MHPNQAQPKRAEVSRRKRRRKFPGFTPRPAVVTRRRRPLPKIRFDPDRARLAAVCPPAARGRPARAPTGTRMALADRLMNYRQAARSAGASPVTWQPTPAQRRRAGRKARLGVAGRATLTG